MTAPDELARALEASLPGRVERDAPSGPLTTYRCGGPLATLVRARNEDDLVAVARATAGADAPLLVVGRGSNLLIADAGFGGVALVLSGDFERLEVFRSSERVYAGGGVPLPVLARRSAASGLGGLEFYVGIPGTVGGAVRMNAGGHGHETKEVLAEVRVLDLADGRARDVEPGALALGFRRSSLSAREVVVSAELVGHASDPSVCAGRIEEIVRWRRRHQPGGANAGSVFVNPPGDAAGRLIEAAGLKGRRVGGAVVSAKHANFIIAEPGATAADVYALIREVRKLVEEASGVRLRPEVRLVGFDEETEAVL